MSTLKLTQPVITCSKLTIETLEQCVKYVTFKANFQNYMMNYPKVIENISDDMYALIKHTGLASRGGKNS